MHLMTLDESCSCDEDHCSTRVNPYTTHRGTLRGNKGGRKEGKKRRKEEEKETEGKERGMKSVTVKVGKKGKESQVKMLQG